MGVVPKKSIKVLINPKVDNSSYIAFLSLRYDITTITPEMLTGKDKIDLVLFTGGEDVSPEYYDQKRGIKTFCNKARDSYENKMFSFREVRHTPKLGICRGAQFLTVMSGGSLIQDVAGHATGKLHSISYPSGLKSDDMITSTHHQMMNPYNLSKESYTIVAVSTYYQSNSYLNVKIRFTTKSSCLNRFQIFRIDFRTNFIT